MGDFGEVVTSAVEWLVDKVKTKQLGVKTLNQRDLLRMIPEMGNASAKTVNSFTQRLAKVQDSEFRSLFTTSLTADKQRITLYHVDV